MGAPSTPHDSVSLASSSERKREILWTLGVVLMVLAFVAASVTWQKGSFLVQESDLFLVDHNDPDRSFLSKVICPHVHDAHLFQGRDLSHVLEFFDAQFIDWCVSRGLPHFYSIVTYLLLATLSVLHWRYARDAQMDRLSCALLLALFWTSPCIFFAGQFLRNAKQGTAFLLFLLIWYLVRNLRATTSPALTARALPPGEGPQAGRRKSATGFIAPFLFGIGLCFMDRQGFFLAGITAITMLVLGVLPARPKYLTVAGSLMAALVIHTGYSRFIAPAVIENVNGFVVSFNYQKLPWDKLFMHPIGYLQQGTNLLVNHFRYFFGNIGGEANSPVLALWGGMLALFYQANCPTAPASNRRWLLSLNIRWAGLFLFWIAAIIGLYILMVMRHFVLVWPDSRTHYYWIPSTTLILLVGTFAIHWMLQRIDPSRRWALHAVLAVALLANLKALPEHRRIQTKGHLEGYITFAPHLLRELRSLPPEHPGAARKFDTRKSVLIEQELALDGRRQTLENPRANASLTPEEFVATSHYVNFVRSRRNLPFRQ